MSRRAMQMRAKTALFVTYTMANPFAVGVFFRAIRLSIELRRRGWACLICNRGPIPDDPKVDQARDACRIILYEPPESGNDFLHSLRLFQEIAPDVIVFGEHPLPFMEPLYRAARVLRPPLLLLEQYYSQDDEYDRFGVDRTLLYGLRSLWREPPPEMPRCAKVIPPFIEEVRPKHELPAPEQFLNSPWLTILGFDERVLQGGIALLAQLQDLPVCGITLSHSPAAASRLMAQAGISAERQLSLALQEDRDLFGFIAASRTVILANGFMQIMEALALACPAVCIHRGIGMDGWSLDESFAPFVSLEDAPEERLERVRGWLKRSPFTDAQVAQLQSERHGLRICADEVEAATAWPRLYPKVQRMTDRLRSTFSRLNTQSGNRAASCT